MVKISSEIGQEAILQSVANWWFWENNFFLFFKLKGGEISPEKVKYISSPKELVAICMIELLRKERRSWCLEWKGFLMGLRLAWICPQATPKRWHQSFHPSDSPTLVAGTMKTQLQMQIQIQIHICQLQRCAISSPYSAHRWLQKIYV